MDIYEHLLIGHQPSIPRCSPQNICKIIARVNCLGIEGNLYFCRDYLFLPNGEKQLMHDIQKAAIDGGDRIVGCGLKNQKTTHMVQYFCCQCAQIYQGSKVNKSTNQIIGRSDYVECQILNNARSSNQGQWVTKVQRKQLLPNNFLPMMIAVHLTFQSSMMKMVTTSNSTQVIHFMSSMDLGTYESPPKCWTMNPSPFWGT